MLCSARARRGFCILARQGRQYERQNADLQKLAPAVLRRLSPMSEPLQKALSHVGRWRAPPSANFSTNRPTMYSSKVPTQHDIENASHGRALGGQAAETRPDALLDNHWIPGQVIIDQHIRDPED